MKKVTIYKPKNNLDNVRLIFKTMFSYFVWKRKLFKYGGFKRGSKKRIFEMGCGSGYFLRWLENHYPKSELFGMDVEPQVLKVAAENTGSSKLLLYTGKRLPFKNNSVDAVFSFQVIEHLKDPNDFFSEAKRILKKNGLFVLTTPNIKGIPARTLGKKWQGYRHDHISLKSPEEWKSILRKDNYTIIEDGSTGLSGFPVLRIFPLSLINWIPMAIFGYFNWRLGESYVVVARKI